MSVRYGEAGDAIYSMVPRVAEWWAEAIGHGERALRGHACAGHDGSRSSESQSMTVAQSTGSSVRPSSRPHTW
jgi:hypothetical protein